MLSNSKSKDGTLKDAHAELVKYILVKQGLQKHKKLVFSEMKYVITIIIQVLCHVRLQLYVSIYYSVLSFTEFKLTLIGVTESNCRC